MWYDLIPHVSILFTLISLPATLIPLYNRWWQGNEYNRNVLDLRIQKLYMRDIFLTVDPYKANGLDTLPDEPVQSTSQ